MTEAMTPNDTLKERVARAICLEDGRAGDTEAIEQQRVDRDWRGYLPAAEAALSVVSERIAKLEEALEPFVRSLQWVDQEAMPVRIGNDWEASAYDLTWDEIERARQALHTGRGE